MSEPEFKNRVDSLVNSLVELHEQSEHLRQDLLRQEQELPDYFKKLEHRAENFEFQHITKNISYCLQSNREIDVKPNYSQLIPTEVTDWISIEQRDPKSVVERGFNSKSFQRRKRLMMVLDLFVMFTFFSFVTLGAISGFKSGKNLTEKVILFGLGGLSGGAEIAIAVSYTKILDYEDLTSTSFLIKDKSEIKLPRLSAAFQELKELQLAPEIKVVIERETLSISLYCHYTKKFEDSLQ